ncbi:MAG: hypothetical protein FGM37_09555, partial [Phycisphaerales bacterium]|nr:hypothetical protein [Phycisphaerales bacterium]
MSNSPDSAHPTPADDAASLHPLDERALGERFGAQVKLLNDFEAVAEGVERVAPSELRPLRGGLRDDAGT